MPTPRAHGGAALTQIPMNTPGFMGWNTEQASGVLGPEWATLLTNAVIDANGRVAARKGWENTMASVIASPFTNFIEYIKSDGSTELVGHAGTAFYKAANYSSAWSAVTGTATPGTSPVRFFNFNNKIVAIQAGEAPAVYDGTSFATVSDVNAPQGVVGTAAFGRMWLAAADGHTLKYSALLDATDYTSADSGAIDMWNVWPGNDEITAVTAFNGALVVFGRKSIIMWTDGAGSALGIDPTTMYVVDVIQGVGCLTQDSLQHIDGDVWFLSDVGVQSLGRVIQEKSNPIQNLSYNIQGYLQSAVNAATLSNVRSVYSPKDRLYLLSLSSGGSTESGRCFAFDTRQRLPDGSARCMGTWTLVPTACTYTRGNVLLMQRLGGGANIGPYSGQLDDTVPYIFDYESGWMDLTQAGYLIMPKRYGGVFWSDNSITLSFKYALDFEQTFQTRSRTFTGSAGGGEWGAGEWGLSEFGGGVNLNTGHVAASRVGEYIKLGLSASINNTVLAVQQLELFCKIGRYA